MAQNKADLAQARPVGADKAIINDLPNEDGVPNHAPDTGAGDVDNHDVLTGTHDGKLFSTDAKFTCLDWTTTEGTAGTPHCGHSWPRSWVRPRRRGRRRWRFWRTGRGNGKLDVGAQRGGMRRPACSLSRRGPPAPTAPKSVGVAAEGMAASYCFALTP